VCPDVRLSYHGFSTWVNEVSAVCLLLMAWQAHPRYRLVLAANRDEFFARPTAALDYWADAPAILAGRDLTAGGTWLGVSAAGRIAAVTNYRQRGAAAGERSRGWLVRDYLGGRHAPRDYLARVAAHADRWGGFNLLVGSAKEFWHLSNRAAGARRLTPGVHGLSNHLLDTPWPKVQSGTRALQDLLRGAAALDPEDLLALLADRTPPADTDLPDTGVGLEWERLLAPRFIVSPDYGTRCSSVLLVERSGHAVFVERTFAADGSRAPVTRRFELALPPEDPDG
jgi:uncharacterized protein with NRDE domain